MILLMGALAILLPGDPIPILIMTSCAWLSIKSFWISSPLDWDLLFRSLKIRFTETIPKAFMLEPNLTCVLLILPLNTWRFRDVPLSAS